MDTVLWIVVGLSAGWATSKLMLSSGVRLVSGIVAGVIGALLGGFSMRLLDPAAPTDHVGTVVAALASAVGLTFVVCVFTWGRRASERSTRMDSYAHLDEGDEGGDMLTYAAVRDTLGEVAP